MDYDQRRVTRCKRRLQARIGVYESLLQLTVLRLIRLPGHGQ